MKSDLVDIACFVFMETPRAFLINDGHREVWVPRSQCEVEYSNHSQSDDPSSATITVVATQCATHAADSHIAQRSSRRTRSVEVVCSAITRHLGGLPNRYNIT